MWQCTLCPVGGARNEKIGRRKDNEIKKQIRNHQHGGKKKGTGKIPGANTREVKRGRFSDLSEEKNASLKTGPPVGRKKRSKDWTGANTKTRTPTCR